MPALVTPPRPSTRRLVVVGAGISGLAAARAAVEFARDEGAQLEVIVLERDREVGGKARTVRRDGWLVETGPTGYLEDEETGNLMQQLARVAGVDASTVHASRAAERRYIVRRERSVRVHTNPLRFAASGLLSPRGLARFAAEPFVAPKRTDADESVRAFAARRIGVEAADRLIAPMVLGVFAGDASRISLPAAFPRLAALEHEHGSLVRGMVARRHSKRSAAGPSGKLTSLRDGLQALPRGLARYGGFRVLDDSPVDALERTAAGRWSVHVAGSAAALEADAVVLAGEAWAAAPLLARCAPRAARELAAIAYPPVTVVALGYDADAAKHIPLGFGMLVPRTEPARMLGGLWDSAMFPGRAPAGSVLVRAMLGGALDPRAADLAADDAVACVRDDLARVFGVGAPPSFHHVTRWPLAIPQYELGHLHRVAVVEQQIRRIGGLHLAGNSLYGVSFSKAAARGWAAGGEAARFALGAVR
jgi:oxygen-dependent protoporphyrinogen oxidase